MSKTPSSTSVTTTSKSRIPIPRSTVSTPTPLIPVIAIIDMSKTPIPRSTVSLPPLQPVSPTVLLPRVPTPTISPVSSPTQSEIPFQMPDIIYPLTSNIRIGDMIADLSNEREQEGKDLKDYIERLQKENFSDNKDKTKNPYKIPKSKEKIAGPFEWANLAIKEANLQNVKDIINHLESKIRNIDFMYDEFVKTSVEIDKMKRDIPKMEQEIREFKQYLKEVY